MGLFTVTWTRLLLGLTLVIAVIISYAGTGMTSGGKETPAKSPRSNTFNNVTDAQAPTMEMENMEKATFAAGCFWGVEAAFRKIAGVVSTSVGYTGGTTENPTYEQVCSKKTGHAEAVEVIYDPAKVGYDDLLGVFWEIHDPTQLNRQGPDIGNQYRSAIFYHTPEQEAQAKASKEALEKNGNFSRPIVTEITPAGAYYKAEDYHQQYLEKRGRNSCNLW